MNLATIPMTQEEAALALVDMGEPLTDEDRMMAKAYRAMRAGKRVLNLYECMRKAGCNSDGLPKLAIAQARATHIFLHYRDQSQRDVYFSMETFSTSGWWGKAISVPRAMLPEIQPQERCPWATVPTIPPKYRPSDIYPYYVLWDAKWNQTAPKDPFLLKKLGGPLYMIVAGWDLTPLERSLLRTR